jgi:dienelactone hydrolase
MIKNMQHIKIAFFCFLIFTFSKAWADAIAEDSYASRVEIIPFQTLNLTDEQILKGDKNGTAVTIAGELRLPRDSKIQKFPVAIIVHGSGGINAGNESWDYQLNAAGIATFKIDGFSGRGLTIVSNDQGRLARFAGVIDIFRADELLAKHARIDPNKIVLIGASRGGTAVIYAALKRLQQSWSPGFRAAATYPFYPSCFDKVDGDEDVTMPIHEFHGDMDDYASIEQCKAWIQRLSSKGSVATSVEYKNAAHSFDNVLASSTPTVGKGSQSARNCHVFEQLGVLINSETQKPFTYTDSCVTLDPKTGFNLEATLESHKAVIEDLRRLFFKTN